jgi:hypothetical protein
MNRVYFGTTCMSASGSRQTLSNHLKDSLNAAIKGQRRPIKFDTLQSYNSELYQTLKLGRFDERCKTYHLLYEMIYDINFNKIDKYLKEFGRTYIFLIIYSKKGVDI